MLSDEEKKAINLLKSYENKLVYEISEKDKKAVKTLLNLIEKQQKEIEELKDTRSIFNMGRRSYKNEIENKIKAKIEYNKVFNDDIHKYTTLTLEEFLEKE